MRTITEGLNARFGGVDGGGSGIRLDVRKGAEYTSPASPIDTPTTATEIDLRLRDD